MPGIIKSAIDKAVASILDSQLPATVQHLAQTDLDNAVRAYWGTGVYERELYDVPLLVDYRFEAPHFTVEHLELALAGEFCAIRPAAERLGRVVVGNRSDCNVTSVADYKSTAELTIVVSPKLLECALADLAKHRYADAIFQGVLAVSPFAPDSRLALSLALAAVPSVTLSSIHSSAALAMAPVLSFYRGASAATTPELVLTLNATANVDVHVRSRSLWLPSRA